MQSILVSSDRLKSLIDNILDVASIDAGYMKLDVSQFSIYSCLRETLQSATEPLPPKDINVTLKCAKNIGNMAADKNRIQQIVIQLLRNSIRMTPTGGIVTLFAKKEDDQHITIGVSDTGPGIPEEEQQHIFDTFYKLRADGYSGTGLGLTIAKSFVELHGGTIGVDSTTGKGTTISFTLSRNQLSPSS